MLLRLRGFQLLVNARGQRTDQQTNAQQHTKRQDVLGVVDVEAEMRWHEKEVEDQHIHDGGCDGRAAAVASRHEYHAQQKQHDDVGFAQAQRLAEPSHQPTQGNDECRRQILFPQLTRPAPRGRLNVVVGLALAANDIDVDVAAACEQFIDDRREQDLPPPRLRGFADDNSRHVAGTGVGQHGVGNVQADQRVSLRAESFGQLQMLRDALPPLIALRALAAG